MKKYFIFGGCSFTAMPNSWARQLTHRINPDVCYIAAHAGGGNTIIANSVIDAAWKAIINKKTPDITIMWSHPSRYDIPINKEETPHYSKIFLRNKQDRNDFNPAVYDRFNYWLLGCGNGHIDFTRSGTKAVNTEYVNAFKEHHKMFWNSTTQWLNTLQAILLIQSLCDANNWSYRFLVYNNFMKHYIKQSDHIVAISKMIKWDKFTFTDDEYGGLREYTLSHLNTWDDGYDMHPSHEAHYDFLDNFFLPKFMNEYYTNSNALHPKFI